MSNCFKSALSILIFFFSIQAWSQKTIDENELSDSTLVDQQQALIHLFPKFDLLVGTTSNITRDGQGTPGTYFTFSPSLGIDFQISDQFIVRKNVSGLIKRFSESSAKHQGNQIEWKLNSNPFWLASDRIEFGINATAESSNSIHSNSDPYLYLKGLQRFIKPSLELYASIDLEEWRFSTSAEWNIQNYSTETTSAREGNPSFHNSNRERKLKLQIDRTLGARAEIGLASQVTRRNYTERKSEFTDGAPPLIDDESPSLLEIFSHGHEIHFSMRWNRIELRSWASTQFDTDLAFGARDRMSVEVGQRLTWSPSPQLRIIPQLSVHRRFYKNFTTDPIGNPANSGKRRDWDGRLAANLAYRISPQVLFLADYSYHRHVTNYVEEPSFSEHTLQSGISLEL